MEVITIDSEAFQSLKEQLNRIESYIERSTTLSKFKGCDGSTCHI